MTTPLLEKLRVIFFNRLTVSIPYLLQFMNAAASLRFSSVEVNLDDDFIDVRLYPHEGAVLDVSFIRVGCSTHLEWQLAVAAQVSNQLMTILSAVMSLTFKYGKEVSSTSSNNETDRTRWGEILGPFSNVKTLHVPNALVKVLSHALQSDEGESSEDLLPELKELEYATTDEVDDAFAEFIIACQNYGRPVTLLRGSVL